MQLNNSIINQLLDSLTDTSPMPRTDERFLEVATTWDLDKLYDDLASVKQRQLTPVERLHLRGLLCGYSPSEIAKKLCKNENGIEVSLSKTIYQYVKGLLNKEGEIGNWRNICEWLKDAGYEIPFQRMEMTASLPVNAIVKLISFQKNKIMIDINIRLVAPLPTQKTDKSDTNN